MTPNRTGILISLTLHGGAIALVYALSSSMAQPPKPIEIDFTVAKPGAPPSPAVVPGLHEEPGGGGGGSAADARAPAGKAPRPAVRKPKKRFAPVSPAMEPGKTTLIPARRGALPPNPLETIRQSAPESPVGNRGMAGSSQGTGVGSGSGSGTGSGNGSGSGSGSSGGTGASVEQLRNGYRAEHFAYIKKIIEENLIYPPRAQRMGWSGNCVIEFVVQANGNAKDIRVIKSTGYELLDDNVIETIKRVDPFPRPPIPVKLKIPFTYSLG